MDFLNTSTTFWAIGLASKLFIKSTNKEPIKANTAKVAFPIFITIIRKFASILL